MEQPSDLVCSCGMLQERSGSFGLLVLLLAPRSRVHPPLLAPRCSAPSSPPLLLSSLVGFLPSGLKVMMPSLSASLSPRRGSGRCPATTYTQLLQVVPLMVATVVRNIPLT